MDAQGWQRLLQRVLAQLPEDARQTPQARRLAKIHAEFSSQMTADLLDSRLTELDDLLDALSQKSQARLCDLLPKIK